MNNNENKEKTMPTKQWLENQIAVCQRMIDQNIGAINLCKLMLRDGVFVDDPVIDKSNNTSVN